LTYLAWARARSQRRAVAYLVVPIVVAGLALTTDNPISERLSHISAGDDVSAIDRVFQPLSVLPHILLNYPAGVPPLRFANTISAPESASSVELLHNGFINLPLNYGWVGFVLIALCAMSLRSPQMKLYMLFFSFQNGAFLAIDKFFIVALSF